MLFRCERREIESRDACLLEVAEDAEVIAAKSAGADDGHAERFGHRLLLGGVRGFDGYTAAGVEIEELRDLIFGPGGGLHAEAGGAGSGTGFEIGVGGDELEEIKGDVFGAAETGVAACVHGVVMVAARG